MTDIKQPQVGRMYIGVASRSVVRCDIVFRAGVFAGTVIKNDRAPTHGYPRGYRSDTWLVDRFQEEWKPTDITSLV